LGAAAVVEVAASVQMVAAIMMAMAAAPLVTLP
jgi:hypothetical protein